MRPFDAALDALTCPLLKPHQRLFHVREGDGIGAVRIWSSLETPHPINQDRQQSFVSNAVDADILDGAVLKQDNASRKR